MTKHKVLILSDSNKHSGRFYIYPQYIGFLFYKRIFSFTLWGWELELNIVSDYQK